MGFRIHSFVQHADNLDGFGSLHTIIDDMPPSEKLAVVRPDFVASLTLARILSQGAKVIVKLRKVGSPLFPSLASLGITTDVAKIVECQLC
jgi:hypothetical protein